MDGETESHFFRIIFSFCTPCAKNMQHAGRNPLTIDSKNTRLYFICGLWLKLCSLGSPLLIRATEVCERITWTLFAVMNFIHICVCVCVCVCMWFFLTGSFYFFGCLVHKTKEEERHIGLTFGFRTYQGFQRKCMSTACKCRSCNSHFVMVKCTVTSTNKFRTKE